MNILILFVYVELQNAEEIIYSWQIQKLTVNWLIKTRVFSQGTHLSFRLWSQ